MTPEQADERQPLLDYGNANDNESNYSDLPPEVGQPNNKRLGRGRRIIYRYLVQPIYYTEYSLSDWSSWSLALYWLSLFLIFVGFILILLGVAILILGLKYGESIYSNALTLDLTEARLLGLHSEGAQLNVAGNVYFDYDKLQSKFFTRLAQTLSFFAGSAVWSRSTMVTMAVQDWSQESRFDNIMYQDLGTCNTPDLRISLNKPTPFSFETTIHVPGSAVPVMSRMARDYILGRLPDRIDMQARTNLTISPVLPLASLINITAFVTKDFLVETPGHSSKKRNEKPGSGLSEFISFNLTSLGFLEPSENEFNQLQKPLEVVGSASAQLLLPFPLTVNVPEIAWALYVPSCPAFSPPQAFQMVGQEGQYTLLSSDVLSEPLLLSTEIPSDISGSAMISSLSDTLTSPCSNSESEVIKTESDMPSPLDVLVESFLNGSDLTFALSLSQGEGQQLPKWLVDSLKDVCVPVTVGGREETNLTRDMIKSITLTNISLSTPNDEKEPSKPSPLPAPPIVPSHVPIPSLPRPPRFGKPHFGPSESDGNIDVLKEDAMPALNAIVKAIIQLPPELDFSVAVDLLRIDGTLSFHNNPFATVVTKKWVLAVSDQIEKSQNGRVIRVNATLKDVPLKITDQKTFEEMIKYIWIHGSAPMNIDGVAGIQVAVAIGNFKVRDIPVDSVVKIGLTEA